MIRGKADVLCTSLEIVGSKLLAQLPASVLRGESTRKPEFYKEAVWVVTGEDKDGRTRCNGTAFYLTGVGFVGARHTVENVEDVVVWYLVRAAAPFDKIKIEAYRKNDNVDISVYKTAAYSHAGFCAANTDVVTGQAVYVLGYPSWNTSADGTLFFPTHVTQGRTISCIRRFGVSGSLLSGTSGGPALDENGQVVGVVNTNYADPVLPNGCISISHLPEVLASAEVRL